MFNIRYAADEDNRYWYSLERHMAESEYLLKVRGKRCYVISDGEKPAGIMRYNLFWDNTPFLNLIYLEQDYRGKGFGRSAMLHWENEMRLLGYKALMTSTQADERAQHFYRKLGYRDSGCLILDSQESMEMFFTKNL